MKRFLKYIWAVFWFYTRLMSMYTWFKSRDNGGRAVILLYHRIIPGKWNIRVSSIPEIKVNGESFEQQLRYLSKSHKVISLASLLQLLKEGNPIPPRTAVITFDDGWEDNYLFAWPLLKSYKLPVTIFLTTGFIGTRKMFWQERFLFLVNNLSDAPDTLKKCFIDNDMSNLVSIVEDFTAKRNIDRARLALLHGLKDKGEVVIEKILSQLAQAQTNMPHHEKPDRQKTDLPGDPVFPVDNNGFLNWEQVKEMQNTLTTFGSHGLNHKQLDKENDDVVIDELEKSRSEIENNLASPARYFAYPNGNYDDRVVRFLKQSGYEAALTTDEGHITLSDDFFRLKRINICENRFIGPNGRYSEEMFAAYLAGLL